MNKWFLLVLLQCCSLAHASQHQAIVEDRNTLEKSVVEVIRANKLKSSYAELLVIADYDDLEVAHCFMRDDLYFNTNNESPDRHFVFMKSLVERMGRNNDAYTLGDIVKRLQKRKNVPEGDLWLKLAESIDRDLDCGAMALPGHYSNVITGMILDLVALFEVDPKSVSDLSHVPNSATVYHMVFKSLNKLSVFCRKFVQTSFKSMYYIYCKNSSKVNLQKLVIDHLPYITRRLQSNDTAHRSVSRNHPHEGAVVSFLQRLSDDELLNAYYLLVVPFLHPCVSQGMLIKSLLLSHGKRTFVNNNRASLVDLLAERLLEQKDPDKIYSVRYKKNLEAFIQSLHATLEGQETQDPYYKKLVVQVNPERKALIKDLLKLYASIGFCDELAKQEATVVTDDIDPTPLFEMIKDVTDTDALSAQIADICATASSEATLALLLPIVTDIQDARLHEKKQLKSELQERVDKDAALYVKAYEQVKLLGNEKTVLESRRKAIKRFGETQKEVQQLRGAHELLKKQLEETRTKTSVPDTEEIMACKKLLGQEQDLAKKLQEQVEALKKENANLKRSNTHLSNAAQERKKQKNTTDDSENGSEAAKKSDAPTESEPAKKKRGRPKKVQAPLESAPEKKGEETSAEPSAAKLAEARKADMFGKLNIAHKK